MSTLTAALLAGCSPDVGVHVRITMQPEQWLAKHPLDHIMVTITADSYSAAACLFPRSATVDAAPAESTASYACADQAIGEIDSSLSATSWGLVEGDSRTVNFELPSAAAATVNVSAGFGAATDLFIASGSISPASDYPELALVLDKQDLPPIFEKGKCSLQLTKVEQLFPCQPEQLRTCLFPFAVGTAKHTAAVWLVNQVSCRVKHTSEPQNCKQSQFVAASTIFDMPPDPKSAVRTAEASFRGRFARCRDGGDDRTNCKLTTQCKPPHILIVSAVREASVVKPPTLVASLLDCLPPTAGPVHFKTDLTAAAGVPSLAVIIQNVIDEDEQDEACFFDLMDLQIEP